MKKVIFILALLQLIVFPFVGYSQNSPSSLKKETKKDKKWLVPASFGQIPNAFSLPGQHPNISSEDLYHPVSINPGPWAGSKLDTIQNKEVFLGSRQINSQLWKDPLVGIDDGDTCTWLSVVGLCMLALVSPVELGY